MSLDAYKMRDLQNCRGIVLSAKRRELTTDQLLAELEQVIGQPETKIERGKKMTSSLVCSVCGSPATKVPVNTNPGNQIGGRWTHAIQCLHRPREGQRWRSKHCGHTEYVVEAR